MVDIESLAARLYLLAYDEDRRRLTGQPELGYLLRAAALTDLTLRGLLIDAVGQAQAVPGAVASPGGRGAAGAGATQDEVLDGMLRDIAESAPASWGRWVSRDSRLTVRAIGAQLAKAGVLRIEPRRVLGLFHADTLVLADPAVQARLRSGARLALFGSDPVDLIDVRDAAVVALAAAGELDLVVSGEDRRRYETRIEELGEHCGSAVPALRGVLEEIRAAALVAVTSTTVTCGS